MSTVTQSLLDYLGGQNPTLNVSKCRPGRNTTSGRTPWIIPRTIKAWDDFEYDALKSVYGGVLGEALGCHFPLEQITVPQLPFCQIHDEKSFESLVTKWNQSVVCQALDATQRHLEGHLPLEKIYMCLGGQTQLPCRNRYPDWAGMKPSTVSTDGVEAKSKNFLPGDTKVSGKCCSANIERGEVLKSMWKLDWIQPVGQIYTYCIRANARYGYVITDKELIVFRIGPSPYSNRADLQLMAPGSHKILDPDISAEKVEATRLLDETAVKRAEIDGTLEFRAIPWAAHSHEPDADDGVMTVNLALWWLHMMAAENNIIEDQYPPLREAVWRPRPQLQATGLASSDGSEKGRPLAKKTHNRRADAQNLESKRGDRKRIRENLGGTNCMEPPASRRKRRT